MAGIYTEERISAFEHALKVLGLTYTYTKEQRIKAYRLLAKQNHPDTHPDMLDAGEKMQKINTANDLLINYDNILPEDRPRKIIKRISQANIDYYVNKIVRFHCDDITGELARKVNDLVNNYTRLMNNAFSSDELANLYSEFLGNLKKTYYDYVLNYLKTNGIDPSLIRIHILDYSNVEEVEHYARSLRDKTVEELKRKVGNILVKQASDFIYRIDEKSTILEETIQELINEYMKRVEMFPATFTNDSYIKEFNDDLSKTYTDYRLVRQRTIKLNQVTENAPLELSIQIRLEHLKHNILENDFDKNLQALVEEMESYDNLPQILFNKVTTRYTAALKKIDVEKEMSQISELSEMYASVTNVIKLFQQGLIGYDSVRYLYYISFNKLDEDKVILDYIYNGINPSFSEEYKINSDSIVISQGFGPIASSFAIRSIDENGNSVIYNLNKDNEFRTSSLDVRKQITLNDFIARGKIVGKRTKDYDVYVKLDKKYIVKNNVTNTFEILNLSQLDLTSYKKFEVDLYDLIKDIATDLGGCDLTDVIGVEGYQYKR